MVLRLLLIFSVSVWTWGQRGQVQMAWGGEQWVQEGRNGQPAPQSWVCTVREQSEAGGAHRVLWGSYVVWGLRRFRFW